MSERRPMIETLEDRTLMFAAPTEPYPVTSTALKAQFTSAIPKVAVGGTTLPITFRIINRTNEVQQGIIDLTFVLHNALVDPLTTSAFDPHISTAAIGSTVTAPTQAKLSLNLKPHGSQVFKYVGTLPVLSTVGNYYFCCSVDPGGFVEGGWGYESTVLGSNVSTFLKPPLTDVNVGTFKFTVNKKTGIGTYTGTVTNYAQNADVAASGTVTLDLFAGVQRSESGATALLPTGASVDTLELDKLAPGKSKKITIKFAVPTGLTGALYLGVRISNTTVNSPLTTSYTTFFSSKTLVVG